MKTWDVPAVFNVEADDATTAHLEAYHALYEAHTNDGPLSEPPIVSWAVHPATRYYQDDALAPTDVIETQSWEELEAVVEALQLDVSAAA